MKKTLLTILAICSMSSIAAQDVKTKKIEVTKQEELKGVYFVMPESSTYKIIWGTIGSPALEGYLTNWKIPGMQSKFVKPKQESDYIFKVNTDGLKLIQANEFTTVEDIPESVLNIKYTMNCSLTIEDKSGKVLKTFIIDDGSTVYTEPYYANFMEFNSRGPQTKELVKKGFKITNEDSELVVVNGFNQRKAPILEIIELNKFYSYKYLYEHIIEYAYGRIKTGKPEILTLEDKYKGTYPELTAKIDELGALIVKMYDQGYNEAIQQEAKPLGDFFAEKIGEYTNDKMLKLLHQNAFTAYTYAGESDEAYHILKAYMVFGKFSWGFPFGRIGDVFDKFELVNQILEAKNENVYIIQPMFTVNKRLSDERIAAKNIKEDALKERYAYNVEKKPGYYIDNEGNQIKGEIVSLEVIENKNSNIMNLSFGKNFIFKPVGDKGKMLKEKDIKEVVVNENRYQFANGILAVVAYENGSYQIMYDPDYDRYMIRRKGDREALALNRFSNKDKKSIEFTGDCKAVTDLVSGKERLDWSSKKDAITLCDLFASCN